MAENSTKRFLKYLILKLKSFFLSKDVLSFLVFLLFSTGFWFVNTLDKEREMNMKIPLTFTGVPVGVSFADPIPEFVEIKIKDLGANLWYYMTHRPESVNIHFTQNFKESGLLTVTNTEMHAALMAKLLNSTSLLEVRPDNIVLKYVKLHAKTVPVRLVSEITLENQHMLCAPLELNPAEIEIYGPLKLLEGITEVETEKLVVNALSESVQFTVPLKLADGVTSPVSTIRVNACAEMFTEKKVMLPVQIINNPQNISIRSFPAEVMVTFNIKMSHFKEFQANDIHVVVDYNENRTLNGDTRKLKLINNKPYISNIRVEPEEVQFILEEKL